MFGNLSISCHLFAAIVGGPEDFLEHFNWMIPKRLDLGVNDLLFCIVFLAFRGFRLKS